MNYTYTYACIYICKYTNIYIHIGEFNKEEDAFEDEERGCKSKVNSRLKKTKHLIRIAKRYIYIHIYTYIYIYI
jgi:hypothetical protein